MRFQKESLFLSVDNLSNQPSGGSINDIIVIPKIQTCYIKLKIPELELIKNIFHWF